MRVRHAVPRILYSRTTVLVVFGVLAVFMQWAPAAVAEVSDTIFTIEAHNDSGTGSFSVSFDQGEWDPNSQTFTWTSSGEVQINDDLSGNWVATLLNAEVIARATQACEIQLTAGVFSGNSDTTFVIGSPLVSFDTVPAIYAQARATATVTLTHVSGDYAYVVGLGPAGTGIFRSYYDGYLSDGTRFTHLVGSVYVNSGGTAEASQADPAFGYRPIGEDLWDMSTEVAFRLTAGDLAFVTTTSLMPEPEQCIGDINGDGVIGFTDLSIVVAAYGSTVGTPNYNPDADFDYDGDVDVVDLAIILAVYGESC